jgi:hypothetical protein
MDRYWVGGSGTWDATTTTNWSATSGGAGGASAPTSTDNVIFDSASNATAYTVTVGTNAVCEDLTAAGPASGNVTFSLPATARIDCHGSMTLPATGLTWTATSGSFLLFRATTTGKTITTNGVSLGPTAVEFNGVSGEWTLGSALTATVSFFVTNGSFVTGNYNVSAAGMSSNNSNVRSISLGSSTVTLTGSSGVVNFATATNLTFNAGTSQITCSAVSPTFIGGGVTFYNVSFTSAASGTATINGANTFNDLTFTSRSATGQRFVTFGANQTVSGALTLGTANTAIRRMFLSSGVVGTQRTLTLNGTLAALADIDFRDINAAGTVATPWTGTRLGNALGNSNITFDAPKTVYWNLAGTQNWSATGWALTNNGVPDVNNFPLAQDTATFTEAGSAGTITYDAGWILGSLQMADGVSNRTTAFTLATATVSTQVHGNITLFSSLTLTGTATMFFFGQGTTQTITSAGVSFTQPIAINSPSGTVQLLDNTTVSNAGTAAFTLTSGTLDLNEFNLSVAGRFTIAGTATRSIDFGSAGKILLTYAAGGAGLTVFNQVSATDFSYAGTSHIELNGNNTAGTRSVGAGGTESQVMNLFVSAGSDNVSVNSSTGYKNLDFTGFSGTLNASTTTIYGNVIFSSTMNTGSGGTWNFAATSGIQQFTSNGVTFDTAITQNGVGGTVQLQDNLTMGSTRTFTLTAGALDLNDFDLTTGLFSSSNSNVRSIAFGTGNITLTGNGATIWSCATATNLSYTGTPTVNLTYAGATGTRGISHGSVAGATEANSLNFNVSAGTDTLSVTSAAGSSVKNLNFTGFAGTFSATIRVIYGNLTLVSGMTLTAGNGTTTFAGTSGTQQITTAGLTLDFPIAQDGVGGTVQLQDDLTIASSRTFTLTNGALDINDKVLSTGLFSSSNSNTRSIDFGLNGQLLVTGTGTAFNAATSTGLSITGTGAKISMAAPTAKTFAGGGFEYPVTLEQAGLGDLTITGANTFDNMTNTVQPCTIIFPASTTTSFKAFNVNGTEGSLVSLRSSSAGTRCVLAKV